MSDTNNELEKLKETYWRVANGEAGFGDPVALEAHAELIKIIMHQDSMKWNRRSFVISICLSTLALVVSIFAVVMKS